MIHKQYIQDFEIYFLTKLAFFLDIRRYGLRNRIEFYNFGGRAFKAISARISLSDTNNPMGQQDGPFRIRWRINEGPAIPRDVI